MNKDENEPINLKTILYITIINWSFSNNLSKTKNKNKPNQ